MKINCYHLHGELLTIHYEPTLVYCIHRIWLLLDACNWLGTYMMSGVFRFNWQKLVLIGDLLFWKAVKTGFPFKILQFSSFFIFHSIHLQCDSTKRRENLVCRTERQHGKSTRDLENCLSIIRTMAYVRRKERDSRLAEQNAKAKSSIRTTTTNKYTESNASMSENNGGCWTIREESTNWYWI